MGQEVVNTDTATEGLADDETTARIKPVERSYTRELLLSFSDLESCKKRPENLDPVVWRDGPTADVAEGAIAIPAISSRGLVRRDSEVFSKSPVDFPEWRKDSWRSGGGGASLSQGPRRKPYDEEPPGNAFSTSYPPRPAANWGDSVHPRNSYERPGLQGQGSGRWEHRAGLGDREREQGRPFQKWDGDEIVPVPVVPEGPRPEGVRSFGGGSPVVRPGWMPAERDGLLGSGGGLHRTYTGSFTGPSSLRLAPERQLSMGLPERQHSMGLPERQNSMGRLVTRNNEPYQPTRPLKPPFVRREDTDFVNDETFGSEGNSTDDRAEQEQKRRESFELMRKDHQRLLQKQQKLLSQKQEERLANPESNASRKHDESALWDSSISSGMPASPPKSPEKVPVDSEGVTSGGGGSIPVLAPSTPRPAIPPGFAKVLQQLQSAAKAPSTNETRSESDDSDTKENLKQTSEPLGSSQENVVLNDANKVHDKLAPMSHDTLDGQVVPESSASMTLLDSLVVASPSEAPDGLSERKHPSTRGSEESGDQWISRTEGGIAEDKQGSSSDSRKEANFSAVDEYKSSQESLLDKWFGRSKSGTVSIKDGVLPSRPLADESQDKPQEEDTWSGVDSRMSKFAQWFHSEESHSVDSGTVPSDILSMFSRDSASKTSSLMKEHTVQEAPRRANSVNVPRNHGRVLPMPSGPSLEDIEKGLTASATSGHEQSATKESSFVSARSLKNLDVELKGDTLSGAFGEHSPVGKFKFPPVSPLGNSGSRSSPVFLTCEDIEQSMLAEAGGTVEKSFTKANNIPRAHGIKKDGQAADNAASRHLLSLLQKGSGGLKYPAHSGFSSNTEPLEAQTKSGKDGYYDGNGWGPTSLAQEGGRCSKTPLSVNPTLEALFGKAFMSELRSVEAPLSASAFAGNTLGNIDGTQALSGAYPTNRQGRVSNSAANTGVSKQWPGTIGSLTRSGWTEGNVPDGIRHGHRTEMPVPRARANQYISPDNEDSRSVSSAHGLWGNGVKVNSHVPDGGNPMNLNVGNQGNVVSNAESSSFVLGDVTDNTVKVKGHLSRAPNSDRDNSSTGEGKNIPSGNFMSGQLRVSEDGTLALSQAKVLSSDEAITGPSTSFDSSGPSQFSKEEDSLRKLVRDGSTEKFSSTELPAIAVEDNPATVSQSLENFLSVARRLDRKDILDDVLGSDNIGLGDDGNSGNVRKMPDSQSDSYILKAKDGNARSSSVSTPGFPEQGNTGLARGNSGSTRFKTNIGGMQPTSGFSAFQPVSPPLQHQQSLGSMYRSEPSTSLQSRQQSSIPVHHHLQQNPGASSVAMFPPQYHPQPGLTQQQLLARAFSNGSTLEFPHMAFGHSPTSVPSRPLPVGHLHFPPSPHGHLSPPGAYHPAGHMSPAPNHFLPSAQMPQRGPIMSPMGDAHIFMQDQALHDPHGLTSKPGPQQAQSLYPLGGHALQSGQGPIFHQPLPHNLRGQQNQFLPGHGPWVMPFSSDLMRTASKGHEVAGYVNGSGVAVGGGTSSVDRWFGMELSRNVSGIPNPGLIQLSQHGLDESKMRFG